MKLMVTDGGPHPADKWADVTVDAILSLIQIADNSESPAAVAARQAKRDLQPQLFAALVAHHTAVQANERESLKSLKSIKAAREAIEAKYNPADHEETETTCTAVCDLLKASPFAAHFAQEEVERIVHRIIGQHTVNSMAIERRWHADRLTKGA